MHESDKAKSWLLLLCHIFCSINRRFISLSEPDCRGSKETGATKREHLECNVSSCARPIDRIQWKIHLRLMVVLLAFQDSEVKRISAFLRTSKPKCHSSQRTVPQGDLQYKAGSPSAFSFAERGPGTLKYTPGNRWVQGRSALRISRSQRGAPARRPSAGEGSLSRRAEVWVPGRWSIFPGWCCIPRSPPLRTSSPARLNRLMPLWLWPLGHQIDLSHTGSMCTVPDLCDSLVCTLYTGTSDVQWKKSFASKILFRTHALLPQCGFAIHLHLFLSLTSVWIFLQRSLCLWEKRWFSEENIFIVKAFHNSQEKEEICWKHTPIFFSYFQESAQCKWRTEEKNKPDFICCGIWPQGVRLQQTIHFVSWDFILYNNSHEPWFHIAFFESLLFSNQDGRGE